MYSTEVLATGVPRQGSARVNIAHTSLLLAIYCSARYAYLTIYSNDAHRYALPRFRTSHHPWVRGDTSIHTLLENLSPVASAKIPMAPDLDCLCSRSLQYPGRGFLPPPPRLLQHPLLRLSHLGENLLLCVVVSTTRPESLEGMNHDSDLAGGRSRLVSRRTSSSLIALPPHVSSLSAIPTSLRTPTRLARPQAIHPQRRLQINIIAMLPSHITTQLRPLSSVMLPIVGYHQRHPCRPHRAL